MDEFIIGDKVVFAKNVWRGRTVLFKGIVSEVTDKTLVITELEDKEGVTECLYSYKRNNKIRVDKIKAYKIDTETISN